MAHCEACPLEPGVPCPSSGQPSLCRNAARERDEPDPRQHYWLDAIRKKAGAMPPPIKLPDGFPDVRPPDGRLRVGVISPSCYLGGADLWVADLLGLVDGARVRWSGAVVRDDGLPIVPEVRDAWARHAPVAVGPDATRALAAASDLLVVWGVGHSWGFPSARLAALVGQTPVLAVSHGSEGEHLEPDLAPLVVAGVAAVSRAALRGLPEGLRASARVILNQVDPARVATTRPPSETRATFGIPEGADVVGLLGRVAAEKRPEVFVRAVAMLPPYWHGLVAGIGYALEDTRRLAEEVAPGRVHFAGARTDVGDVLAAIDVMAMPTRSEACSMALNEAWLAGIPAISTAAGMLEEHPDLARIVPNPPTPRELADAILDDAAQWRATDRRVATARSFAREHLSPGRFAREWTDLICSLVAAPEPPGLLKKAANLARSVVAHVADSGRKASPEVQAARRESCFSCSRLDKTRDKCSECGCQFMETKRSWASSSCPLVPPRWEAV